MTATTVAYDATAVMDGFRATKPPTTEPDFTAAQILFAAYVAAGARPTRTYGVPSHVMGPVYRTPAGEVTYAELCESVVYTAHQLDEAVHGDDDDEAFEFISRDEAVTDALDYFCQVLTAWGHLGEAMRTGGLTLAEAADEYWAAT